MFVRCLRVVPGWAAGEDGVGCEVKRWQSWPWEIQSEGQIGLPSLKCHGNGCFYPEMYMHSRRQGGFQSVLQN